MDITKVEFAHQFIKKTYKCGDIISYNDLLFALGDGYGDPGNVDIATLKGIGWYPAGYCSKAKNGVWDCDETRVFPKSEYGKTWIAVCSSGIDGWMAADAGQAYLLDL